MADKKKLKTERIFIRMDPDHLHDLDLVCKYCGLSRSELVRMLTSDFLRRWSFLFRKCVDKHIRKII